MLFMITAVIMKILEFASGRLIDVDGFITKEEKVKKRRRRFTRKSSKGLSAGRGMTTVDELSVSPASDCNSNNVDVSYNSTASDAEFIQDNSDYQWFTEYGYSREVHQHQSVLSSGYDELARDLDSQLALVDMEDYSAQEILSTLPAMCCTDMQSERQGEMFASVSGSLMVKYDFDSSISPHSSSQEDESVSMSEPLFSPVKESPLPCTNYSVDSLDCDCEDLVLTCQATNKNNYTIAFHASTTMQDTSSNQGDDSVCSSESEKKDCCASGNRGMATSESPTMTWSKMRRLPARHRHRSKTISLPDLGPAPQPLSNSLAAITDTGCEGNGQFTGCVKLYDIQKSGSLTSEGLGDLATGASFNKQENFSLLRLFIQQRTQDMTTSPSNDNDNDNRSEQLRNNNGSSESGAGSGIGDWGPTEWAGYEDSLIKQETETDDSSSVERISSECKSDSVCTCSMSTSSHKFNVNNNNSFEREPIKKHNVKIGTSTSDLSSATNSSSGDVPQTVKAPAPKCPVHCMDRSMQTSQHVAPQSTKKGMKGSMKAGSPVYVLYPNYTLPDLGFLRQNKLDMDKVLLTPLKYSPTTPPPMPTRVPLPTPSSARISPSEIQRLKKKGFGHIMDWSSLMPLLPSDCWSLLSDVPQVRQHSHARFDRSLKPQFCMTPNRELHSHLHCEGRAKTSSESGCSEGTSGYRGSSTLLTESTETKQSNPLFVYNYSSTENQQQPAKLRTKSDSNHNTDKEKRFSMFEFPESILDDVFEKDSVCIKRKSLPAHVQNTKGEKEGWECWMGGDRRDRSISPPARHALRLDQLLGTAEAASSLEAIDWTPTDVIHLRHQVSRYLSENNKKNVSFAKKTEEHQRTPPNSPANQKNYQVKPGGLNEYYVGQDDKRLIKDRTDIFDSKKELVEGVVSAVEKLLSESSQEDLAAAALGSVCPALYALMSDGLKPHLDTPFGPIGNSVWQVVEASAHQGLVTKALNDLVMKLNSEDVLSEGLIKFNAFIFGLLNVGGVEAWVSYIRTRESVLNKHYKQDALMLTASQGHAHTRALTDWLINSLKPLSQVKFNLDLLYETRLLHTSLLQLNRIPVSPTGGIDLNSDSLLVRKIVQSLRSCGLTSGSCASCESTDNSEGSTGWRGRPRSCVERVDSNSSNNSSSDAAAVGSRKRWSGVPIGSRLVTAFDSLAESSMTPVTPVADPPVGKFRTLQRKWELLSNKTTLRSPDLSPVKSSVSSTSTGSKSRIPRPVTSPVRAGARLPGGATPTRVPMRNRVSRLDGGSGGIMGHTNRPASLPQSRGPSAAGHATAAAAQRRAASSSSTRPAPSSTSGTNRKPKPPQPYYNSYRSRIPIPIMV